MNADSVIFDLDGTLWDATTITSAAWDMMREKHPSIPFAVSPNPENIKKYMGLTNEELAGVFMPSLPFDEAFALMSESCRYENKLLERSGGVLYPGVREMLSTLSAEGFRLFVVSNCQSGYIEAFVATSGLCGVFDDIECSGNTGLPKCDNIWLITERNHILAPVYVGDTVSDETASREAGIPFIYAKYGFGESGIRGRARSWDAEISSPAELCGIICNI